MSYAHILPWTFRLDRWGPRRPPMDQPITRGGWDGQTFIGAKSPGENYSVVWKWHLLRPGELAIDAFNWTYLPSTFDFHEASIPDYYVPDTFVYKRMTLDQFPAPYFAIQSRNVSWERQPLNDDVTFALQRSGTQLRIVCGGSSCTVGDPESRGSRKVARGETMTISIPSRWSIQVN